MTMTRESEATWAQPKAGAQSAAWFMWEALGWVALALGAVGFVLVGFFSVGCASGRPGPDELSAESHHRKAIRAANGAALERPEYYPHAVAPVFDGPCVRTAELTTTANPTTGHLHTAARLGEHARQHTRTAAELERFEETECAGFSPPVRAACPVLSSAALKIIPNGILVHLTDPDATASTVALMRCHLAYAQSRGFDRVPDCPLYVPGVAITASVDGLAVELTSSDRDAATEIVRRGVELIGR